MRQVYVQNWNDETKPLDHDYNIVETENGYSLEYSNNSNWHEHVRNKQALSLSDTGDGLIIRMDDLKNPIKLDYHQAIKLLTILLVENDTKIEIRESKLIKSI